MWVEKLDLCQAKFVNKFGFSYFKTIYTDEFDYVIGKVWRSVHYFQVMHTFSYETLQGSSNSVHYFQVMHTFEYFTELKAHKNILIQPPDFWP